ncbi:MAG: hypothetical protein ABIR19_02080 [Ginsengibacter sp.]
MEISSFRNSLSQEDPPHGLSAYVESLWFDAKGNWGKAHEVVQDINTQDAAWIHAYLHRKEGDVGNADYWYVRAGKRRPGISLQKEWEDLLAYFLSIRDSHS